jgi:hypothetical protein
MPRPKKPRAENLNRAVEPLSEMPRRDFPPCPWFHFLTFFGSNRMTNPVRPRALGLLFKELGYWRTTAVLQFVIRLNALALKDRRFFAFR